jgi:choline dehydrogenase
VGLCRRRDGWPRLNRMFESAPEPRGNNRALYLPRGHVFVGSSAINGLVYTRGHPADYDL